MSNLFQLLGGKRATGEQTANWLQGLEAIVAVNEDPEHQHRIKVVIPFLDENTVYDKWIRPIGVFVLGPGYGSFFVPPLGSEVTLFARLGGKHNLFYAGAYNESFVVPADFRDAAVCGIRAPGELKLISELDLQLRSGRTHIEADSTVRIIAPGGVFINDRRV
jgi:hypothetical protein